MSEVWKILVGVTWMFSRLVCLTFLWSILSISCIFPVKYEPSFRSSSWSFHRFKQPTDYWVLSTECRDFWNSNFVTIGPSRWQVEDQEERGIAGAWLWSRWLVGTVELTWAGPGMEWQWPTEAQAVVRWVRLGAGRPLGWAVLCLPQHWNVIRSNTKRF